MEERPLTRLQLLALRHRWRRQLGWKQVSDWICFVEAIPTQRFAASWLQRWKRVMRRLKLSYTGIADPGHLDVTVAAHGEWRRFNAKIESLKGWLKATSEDWIVSSPFDSDRLQEALGEDVGSRIKEHVRWRGLTYTVRLPQMKVVVDSVEYRSWHEVGHATACLHLGGDVTFIELLDGDARGHARARCVVMPEIERSVACAGFATEFYLLNSGHAEQRPDDGRNISQVVFHNATSDREEFWGRKLERDEVFSRAEDEAFMQHAIEAVAPIFNRYFSGMQQLVRELCDTGRVEGRRVEEVLLSAARAAS